MKITTCFLFIFCIVIILAGCNSTLKDATNTLVITQDDEKKILEYLDTKTDDIARPIRKEGRMYSAFKLLGTDQDKIYIWLLKMEYMKIGEQITHEEGDAVSAPLVLKIKKNDAGISIINHKCPEEGEGYGRSAKRLFPPNIKFPEYDEILKLEQFTKARAEEYLK